MLIRKSKGSRRWSLWSEDLDYSIQAKERFLEWEGIKTVYGHLPLWKKHMNTGYKGNMIRPLNKYWLQCWLIVPQQSNIQYE